MCFLLLFQCFFIFHVFLQSWQHLSSAFSTSRNTSTLSLNVLAVMSNMHSNVILRVLKTRHSNRMNRLMAHWAHRHRGLTCKCAGDIFAVNISWFFLKGTFGTLWKTLTCKLLPTALYGENYWIRVYYHFKVVRKKRSLLFSPIRLFCFLLPAVSWPGSLRICNANKKQIHRQRSKCMVSVQKNALLLQWILRMNCSIVSMAREVSGGLFWRVFSAC